MTKKKQLEKLKQTDKLGLGLIELFYFLTIISNRLMLQLTVFWYQNYVLLFVSFVFETLKLAKSNKCSLIKCPTKK